MTAEGPTSRLRTGRLLARVIDLIDEATEVLSRSGPDSEDLGAARTRLQEAAETLSRLARPGLVPAVANGPPVLLRRQQLPLRASSARAARVFAKHACVRWGLAESVTSRATDVLHELVANGLRVAAGPLVVELELGREHLLVRCWDDGPGVPKLLPYRPGVSARGLGLHLVQQLSEQWGWVDDQGGTWVWARIALPDPTPVPPPGAPT